MAILSIRHLTRYRYRRAVTFGEHRMMLRPLEGPDQRILAAELSISPEPAYLRHLQDSRANWISLAGFDRCACELSVESRVRIEHRPQPAFIMGSLDVFPPSARFLYAPEDLADLREGSPPVVSHLGEVARWARRFAGPGASVAAVLTDMTEFIHRRFDYRRRLERGTQPAAETLRLRTGSCRDLACLMIEAVASLGLAAGYVSGYVNAGIHPSIAGGGQGGHTHAWVRVFLPSSGWVDFDPTNGIVGGDDLIRVAVTRSAIQAIPVSGSWEGDARDYLGMDVEVEVSTDTRRRDVKEARSAEQPATAPRKRATVAA